MAVDFAELSGRNPYVEICLRPTVAKINDARRFISGLYEPLLGDAEAASRFELATSELVENALMYAVDGRPLVRVELSRATPPSRITLETRNRISARQRATLDGVFDRMQRAPSPTVFHEEALERCRRLGRRSGLGLARVWAEAEMHVWRSYADDEVRIVAMATLAAAPR